MPNTTTIDYFADNWEDIIDQEEPKEEPKEEPVSAWKSDHKETNTTQEYRELFPSLNPATDKKMKDEKKKQERRVKKSATNIFALLDEEDDEESDDEPTHPVQRQVTPDYKPIMIKTKTHHRSMPKSKLCGCVTEGAHCQYGERCKYAHSLQELYPDRCKHGQKCRCITVGYDKTVRNNQRSHRVCMYTHDESHLDYLKRTGLDRYKSCITVSGELMAQASEMARVTGVMINAK
jgi:hypothetical protein